jgi:uncharacterized membrane protein YkoI
MRIKVLVGSAMAVGLLGLGVLAGSLAGSNGAFAQTPSGSATVVPGTTQNAPAAPSKDNSSSLSAKITQQQAETAALAANPGSTVDHTSLQSQNSTAVYDVDFTDGGGAIVNGDTGAVISSEAAGQDKGGKGGHGGPGGFGGRDGGADQAALAAKATVTQLQAESAALTASPGKAVDHSRLGDDNGTVFWDVDFTDGGGVTVNAQTGAVIATEAAGTDQGGRPQAPATTKP